MLVIAVVVLAKLDGPEQSSGGPPALAACEKAPTRETCSEIAIDGRSWRYGISRATPSTRETVILDIGGPGQSVLTSPDSISAARGGLSVLSRYNLIVFEEPWVTAVPTKQCEAAMTAFYTALRDGVATAKAHALDMSRTCGVDTGANAQNWGFRPAQYEKFVSAVVEKEGLSLAGFVGHSWGIARLAYLSGARFNWAVLVRPFPIGVGPDRLADARAAALGPYKVPASLSGRSVTLQSRSVPVSSFDAFSSWVGSGYVDDSDFQDIRAKLKSGSDPELIGKMSDNYWGRYRVTSLSPALLAQVQEMCPVVGASSTPFNGIADGGDVIRAGFLPCAGQAPADLEFPSIGRLCVVTSPHDAVVPQTLIQQSSLGVRAPKVTWVESAVRSHRSFDGGEQCLQQAMSGEGTPASG